MAKDPYRYFRIEAAELHAKLEQGVLALSEEPASPDLLAGLRRHAHTLKGAARVVRADAIAQAAHALEDALASVAHGAIASPAAVRAMLAELDRVRRAHAALGSQGPEEAAAKPLAEAAPAPPPATASGPATARRSEPVAARVDLDEIEELHALLVSAGLALSELRARLVPERGLVPRDGAVLRPPTAGAPGWAAAEAAGAHTGRATEDALARLGRPLEAATHLAGALRLLPVAEVFGDLDRAAHDAATGAGRRARIVARGGELRLEPRSLSALREALLHLVRNAVVHGIETPGERVTAGKPEVGTVALEIERRSDRLLVRCRDDGRGIDGALLRRRALASGALGPEEAEALDDEGLLALAFRSGVSTTGRADHLSGRGVGLAAARRAIEAVGGRIALESAPGKGTQATLTLPPALSSMRLLRVTTGEHRIGIPFAQVAAAQRVASNALGRDADGLFLTEAGIPVRLRPLPVPGGLGAPAPPDRPVVAIRLSGGDPPVALVVDRLLGVADLEVRPLPALAGEAPGALGIARELDGSPLLVLDARAALRATPSARAPAARPERPRRPVLVIDDSLTSRMLERSILEAAGFEVDVAESAEDALGMARSRAYGIFLVDVELPGMDGFDFVAATRTEPALAEVPAILVTSRSDAADRRRGKEVGAYAYISKGEFDQEVLLRTIRTAVES